MLLVKISNGTVEEYPYTINDLRREHSHTSFPKTISEETLAKYGVYSVTLLTQPNYDYLVQNIVPSAVPYLDSGSWVLSYTVEDQPQEIAEGNVRSTRNQLLEETDWTALSDNTMTTSMAEYRQALRDVTSQEGFPYDVTWPTKPE